MAIFPSSSLLHTCLSDGIDDAALHASVKNITQHLLETLPVAGENYMIVFKLIHDLCLGEMSLFPSDISLLEKHVELGEKAEGGERKEVEEGEKKEGEKKEGVGKGNVTALVHSYLIYPDSNVQGRMLDKRIVRIGEQH